MKYCSKCGYGVCSCSLLNPPFKPFNVDAFRPLDTYVPPAKTYVEPLKPLYTYVPPIKTYVEPIKPLNTYVPPVKTYVEPIKPLNTYYDDRNRWNTLYGRHTLNPMGPPKPFPGR